MRSNLVKLALGCGLAAAFVAPAFACEFYKQTVKTDRGCSPGQQATRDSSQAATPDTTPQTAESQPAPERRLELTMRQGRGR